MKDFIDKTSETAGTPINRANVMAIQGFISANTTFNSDGSITEQNANGETLTTTFDSDGSIRETFVGKKTITKITSFVGNRTIVEVLE